MKEKKVVLIDSLVKANVNKHGYTVLQLVTEKSCNLLRLTMGNESTESLSPESVSRVTSDISSPLESAILPMRFLGTFDMIFILYAVKSDTTVTAIEYFPSQSISFSVSISGFKF